MKPSLILRTSAPALLWLPVAVSLYVLLRGHNEPGGGFLGGLVAAAGVLFYTVARGGDEARRVLLVPPITIAAAGVLIAGASGLPALFQGAGAYLTHLWAMEPFGIALPVGTTLIFDIGVYLTVVGMACTIFQSLLRWQDEHAIAPGPSQGAGSSDSQA